MILCDSQIATACGSDPQGLYAYVRGHEQGSLIVPFKSKNLQPASVDLTLDQLFLLPQEDGAVDLGDVKGTAGEYEQIVAPVSYTLSPQAFILGSTAETIQIHDDLVARIEGKSSLARLGLLVHSTAGYVDPGFRGKITLELFNLSHREIILRPGLRICQISFEQLSDYAVRPYGHPLLDSKYQGQDEPTPSRYRG